MDIKVKLQLKEGFYDLSVDKGISLEEIAKQFQPELPYTVLAAKVDNRFCGLTEVIDKPCSVELLDMRTQAANVIFQRSLCLIYLKAAEDVLGKIEIDIQNSLNKGLYTEVKTPQGAVDEKQVEKIADRMRQLIAEDIPIEKNGMIYSLDGYEDLFYGLMVPSTGYINKFELRKYRRGILLRFPQPRDPSTIPEYQDQPKLYAAFGEATSWNKLLEVSYVADLNEKIENGDISELIQLSEALHQKKIVEIADEITDRKKRIVLIAGPSSSGKTTFAKRLCIQLMVNGKKPLYLGTDDYFTERKDAPVDENGEYNYEDLIALDIDLFNNNMNDLLQGRKVDIPSFDFMSGTKKFGDRITSINASQPIVIEGIHALNDKLTEFIPDNEKYKIYISPFTQLNIDKHNRIPTTDSRMLRRMVRDYNYRGHTAQSTIKDWPKVRAGEDKNIFPFNNAADVMFNSAHNYEVAVLKKYVKPILAEVKQTDSEYGEATRLLNFIDLFKTIENDAIIVNNSILREFIGGSIFWKDNWE